MRATQDSAELAVRNLLKRIAEDRGGKEIHAADYMDDGTPIMLKVTIDRSDGSAIFDFTGTGPEVYGEPTLLGHRGNTQRTDEVQEIGMLQLRFVTRRSYSPYVVWLTPTFLSIKAV